MNARQVWIKAIVKDDSESSSLLRHLEAKGQAEHVANDVTEDEGDQLSYTRNAHSSVGGDLP